MQVIDATTNLTPLWQRLRASFARAAAATGGAARIAAHTALAHALRREIHGWVALLEHLVRKLLFAEAGRLEAQPVSSLRSVAQRRTRAQTASAKSAIRNTACGAAKHDPANPETWSARFALAPPRDPRAVPDARAPRIRALWGPTPQPPPPVARRPGEPHTPLHLARRFEALRRVLADPRPYARRLANLMRRLVRRHPEAPLRFTSRSARVSHFDRDDPRLGVECCAAAFNALPAFDSS